MPTIKDNYLDVDLGTAAEADIGTGLTQVPTNGDLPAFGTAAEADIGTGATQIPTNSDLPDFGTAAEADTGLGATQVPTNGDLGTAATKDVQTSSTDNTVGRVLLFGAFGLGDSEPSNPTTDLDTFPDQYIGAYSDNFGNVPSVENGIIFCQSRNTTTVGLRKSQLAITSSNAIYVRTNIGGVWTSWQEIWNEASYQPDNASGLGVVRRLYNTGGNISAGGAVSGANLSSLTRTSAGSASSTFTQVGTWQNVSGGTVSNAREGDFLRIS